MAWTKDDIELIDDAIKCLVAGHRQVEVVLSDRVIRYSDVELEDLRAFRAEVMAVVNATGAPARSRIHLGIFRKGL